MWNVAFEATVGAAWSDLYIGQKGRDDERADYKMQGLSAYIGDILAYNSVLSACVEAWLSEKYGFGASV